MINAVKSENKRSNMNKQARMQVKYENNKANLDRTKQDIVDDPGGWGYSKLTEAEAKTAGCMRRGGRKEDSSQMAFFFSLRVAKELVFVVALFCFGRKERFKDV